MKFILVTLFYLLSPAVFAAPPEVEKAIVDLASSDIQVRRDAMNAIAYSEDPRIPYACLPLLKDPGSTTRRLAARAIGSRFQFIEEKDVSRFVKALGECIDNENKESPNNRESYTQKNCRRAIGLLTRNYNFPDVFDVSPDGKWAVYERKGCPMLINTETHTIKAIDLESSWSFNCYWSPDSSILGLAIIRNRHTSIIGFYKISDREIWEFDPNEIHQKFKLYDLLPGSGFPGSSELEFGYWKNGDAILKMTETRLDQNNTELGPFIFRLIFTSSTGKLALIN